MGLQQILQEEYPLACIEIAENGGILVTKAIGGEWDIIISDMSMPVMNGLEALQHIKKHSPKLPILILSIHSGDQYAISALKAGASGYLPKEMAQDELVNAVTKILSGKKYISDSLVMKIGPNPFGTPDVV